MLYYLEAGSEDGRKVTLEVELMADGKMVVQRRTFRGR